jgi:hypothetical protein
MKLPGDPSSSFRSTFRSERENSPAAGGVFFEMARLAKRRYP